MRKTVFRKSLALLLIAAVIASVLAIYAPSTVIAQGGGKGSGNRAQIQAAPITIDTSALVVYNGRTNVIVQFTEAPTAAVWGNYATSDAGTRDAQVAAALNAVTAQQDAAASVLSSLPGNAVITSRMRAAINAVSIQIDADQVQWLRWLPGVKSIEPVTLVERGLGDSTTRIGAPQVWNYGGTGAGMKIAVIDDGIDYKHAHFGGTSGTTWNPSGPTTAKVVAGYDFVGDAYDARFDPDSAVVPDPDPLTCQPSGGSYPVSRAGETSPVHHGTHVSGIALGYGVKTDNTTYTGPYNSLLNMANFKIAPGTAPLAQLYAYRVFGCYGSTSSTNVLNAINRAVDPDNNGNPSDRVDVINMSLGSSYSNGAGSGYVAAIDNAVAAGVVVVASAGNGFDSFFITGAPAASPNAISVANSSLFGNTVTVNLPATLTAIYSGFGAAFGPQAPYSLTDDVVIVQGASGSTLACNTEPPANGAAISGNIALVDRGGCSFDEKILNAQNVGAVGVLMCSNATAPGTMGVATPSVAAQVVIPSVMLSQAQCAAFRSASGLNITLAKGNADGLSSSTSRGPRRSSVDTGILLKPDLTAPGDNILSSVGPLPNGTGNQSARYGGTSMAAPHVAGMVAILRQQFPSWTPQEIKALLMNTANRDLFFAPGDPASIKYGNGRVGAGLANVLNASQGAQIGVIGYDTLNPNYVTANFGLLEPQTSTQYQRTITLKNKGAAAVYYNVSIQETVSQNGSSVSVSPTTVTVPAGGTASVTLTITANPFTNEPLKPDATVALTQAGLLREWLSEVTGNVVFTPTFPAPSTAVFNGVLRVPYYSIVRPTANSAPTSSTLALGSTVSGTTNIGQSGYFNTGAMSSLYNATSVGIPMQLIHSSPNEPNVYGVPEDHGDIKYVGVSSDFGATGSLSGRQIFFGIQTYGNRATPKEMLWEIEIDSDRNGTYDYVVNTPRFSSSNIQVDLFLSASRTFTGTSSSSWDYLNPVYFTGNPAQTYNYETDTVVLAMGFSRLNITGPFNFRVRSFSYEYFDYVDTTPVLTYNPTAEAFSFTGGFSDLSWWPTNGSIPVDFNQSNYTASTPAKLMIIYPLNASSAGRVKIVNVTGDFLPDPASPETFGVHRASAASFYLRNTNTSGPADISTAFGLTSGDLPVVGDWDGDGDTTVGLFRESSGLFILSNSNSPASADVFASYGAPGDAPVAGDWDGNGTDTIAIYRTGVFMVRNSNTSGLPDAYIQLGDSSLDEPLSGDWDSNGTDTPGVHRPSAGAFYLTNQSTSGAAPVDIAASYGSTTDVGFAGDWNGDGTTGIGIFRPGDGLMMLRESPSTGLPDIYAAFGASGDVPLAGTWTPGSPDSGTAPVFVPRN